MARSELDNDFVERQRERLHEIRGEIVGVREGMEGDERDRSEEFQDTQPDSGDESQYIHEREVDQTIADQAEARLENVERALAKIEEGSYGICDDTGEEIPRGRLEAMPEATTTVEAQQRRDERRSPGLGGASY